MPSEAEAGASRPVGAGLHGWLVIDKPEGITSSRVVGLVKRHTGAKAGHAGTLDPLATGILPVALGEATKTIRFVTAGWKRYRFTVRWGIATATDDREGEPVAESAVRPSGAAIEAALAQFCGTVRQRPPAYSAIKIGGKRAYALARAGQITAPAARDVAIDALVLTALPDPDHATFEATVGAGTYIRSLARDLALALDTVGHVVALRRLAVGRFGEADAISLDSVKLLGHSPAASGQLLPIEAVLDDIPALALTADETARLRHGQQVTPREPRERARLDRLVDGTIVGVRHGPLLVGLARIENGGLRPLRILNR